MIIRTLLIATIFSTAIGYSVAAELPTPSGHVNDLAHLLTPEQAAALEQKVMTIERTIADHPQIAVLLITKLPQDEDIDSYKNKVFAAWGIGQKGLDNGILLVVAQLDRKIGIEVGYGAEARITDAEVHTIINNKVKPNLTRGAENWYRATDETVTAIGVDLANTVEPVAETKAGSKLWIIIPLAGLILGGLFGFSMLRWRAERKRRTLRTMREARESINITAARSPQSSTVRSTSTAPRPASKRTSSTSSTVSTSIISSNSSYGGSSSSSFGGGESGGGGGSDSF